MSGERTIENTVQETGENKLTVEILHHGGLEVDIDTLDVILHLAHEQLLHHPIHRCTLHLVLQLVLQDPVEFLDVVLHERVRRFPTKRLGELARA
jgi:hypothetical protein